ncbi:unnamed protein product [Cuscuta campestris]|uniref:Transposase (putative) gypsy type domain-containing protein n=1 Tax=Cuscuta campestris TaxID=132261 RepID=A0A484MJN1_9ASTE|nr:unnamed protein product [Cuscuta campestris]
MSSDSQNISGQSYGSGSQPSSSSHFESSSPPVTPLIRRPSHQPSSQAQEIVAQEPVPLNQLHGRFNPKVLSWDQWEERLGSMGYLALDSGPVFKESSRVTKKVLAEVRSVLPPGYKVISNTTWPNIIEPHQGNRLGFHVASLEGGIIFPLRPLLVEICDKFKILPGQLTPNAHRFLNCFVNICESLKITPSLDLFLHMYDVLPGTINCPGFVYFHSRANSRGFLTGLPPSHKKWKQRFVFVEFPPDQFPLSNREWADRVIKPERVHPEPTPELEDACEKLLKGDPVTGKPYAYGGWVYRLPNPDGGESATHDAEDDRANSLDGHAEASSPRPGIILRLTGLIPPKSRSNQVGVISEEIGQTLKEKDQVSQLTLLLDSAKLEINDRAERERRLEEELKEERARFALLEEERKRKVAELEDALGQAEESARAKEEAFPTEAAHWAACHHLEIARSILTTPEETMDFFKTMYQEPEGKRMITEIGSYGFQCGQKDERSLLYARLLKRDPSFDPTKMKLPALYKEEPAPPFPRE